MSAPAAVRSFSKVARGRRACTSVRGAAVRRTSLCTRLQVRCCRTRASARASLMPSGLAASSAASASSRIVSGSTPTSSAAASLFRLVVDQGMPASWFVMGGSRPAWGGFGMVASRRVSVFRRAVGGGDDPGRRRPVQRSCSIEVVRVLRMCGHVVRISTIPIVSAPDECPAGCPLRRRLVMRVPHGFRWCSSSR